MRIAVLGWGSLVWSPRELRISGGWQADGPRLPIEFARISKDGRLTLVIYEDGLAVPTLWAVSAAATVSDARSNLRLREGTLDQHIASTPPRPGTGDAPADAATELVEQWRRRQGLDAVVWTNLPSNFEERSGLSHNGEHVVAYLLTLKGEQRKAAEEYMRRAPAQIRTPIRQFVEQRLGWRPIDQRR